MKAKLDAKSLIVGGLIGGMVVFTVSATNDKTPVAWEYSVVTAYAVSPPSHSNYANHHSQQLNKHADQGWEVVCSHTLAADQSHGTREIVLRRVKK